MNELQQTLESILGALRCILVVLILIGISIPGKSTILAALDEFKKKDDQS